MQTTAHGWQIIDQKAGVLSYSYKFASDGQANSFTARLPSGGMMIISPPSRVDPQVIADVQAFGKIEAIVANNGFHHLGIAQWREHCSGARCFAAPGAIKRIGKKSKDAGTLEPLSALQALLGSDVGVVEAPSSKAGETWAWAKIDGGYAWYASDVLANMQLPSAFVVRQLFKWTNSAPGYKVFRLAVKLILQDKHAALSRMLDDVNQHPPRVMVPAHGEILSGTNLAADTQQLLQAEL